MTGTLIFAIIFKEIIFYFDIETNFVVDFILPKSLEISMQIQQFITYLQTNNTSLSSKYFPLIDFKITKSPV